LKIGAAASVNNYRHTVLRTLEKLRPNQLKLTAVDVWGSSCNVTQHISELRQKENKTRTYLIWGMIGTFLLRIYAPTACLKT
jgi:hypothetical protein